MAPLGGFAGGGAYRGVGEENPMKQFEVQRFLGKGSYGSVCVFGPSRLL